MSDTVSEKRVASNGCTYTIRTYKIADWSNPRLSFNHYARGIRRYSITCEGEFVDVFSSISRVFKAIREHSQSRN